MASGLLLVIGFVIFHSCESAALFKKGRCPIVNESDLKCHREFVSECLVDTDCNGTVKCCRTACHQYKCIEPVPADNMCQKLGDIAFVLDASGSIGKEYFENSKVIIKKLIQAFPPEKNHRHATVVYGDKPSIEFNFIASKAKVLKSDDLFAQVDKIQYRNFRMTRIDSALRLVREKIFSIHENQDRTQIMVLFTDGVQSTPPYGEGFALAGRKLDENNIKVLVVMSGGKSDINALLKLCSNDQLLFSQEFLSEMIAAMASEMQYTC